MRRLTFAIAAAICLGACTSIDCPVENNVATSYKLTKADGSKDTLADTLTVLTRQLSGGDTILLNKSVSTTEFQLPISYTNQVDTLTFIRKGDGYEVTDTVWLEKTNLPPFEYVDCNLVYFHEGLAISYTNDVDTLTFIRKGDGYEISDTVWLEKTNLPQFESVDCNLVYFHDVLSINHTRHGIDSITINKRRIDYDSKTEHFHIHVQAGM